MSELWSAIIIAIVQGLTEWLPVSSSGHLILAQKLLGFTPSLSFDVALHFGTLLAVFVYFGKDITDILQDLLRLNFKSQNGRLGVLLLLATIPAAIVGLLSKSLFESVFASLEITALGFAITGIVLTIASLDLKIPKTSLTARSALIIGCAQVFALFPGISRSGTTMSTGLLLGLDKESALKFSFLLAIPIIFGANLLTMSQNPLPVELFWATLVAFIIGLITLHILYKLVLSSRKNLRWFAAYAFLLAISICIFLV